MSINRKLVITALLLVVALLATGADDDYWARVEKKESRVFIIDQKGERWEVTRAVEMGFDPELFRYGKGRDAYTPLDDGDLSSETTGVPERTRVLGVSDGTDSHAYALPRMRKHEFTNTTLGKKKITAYY